MTGTQFRSAQLFSTSAGAHERYKGYSLRSWWMTTSAARRQKRSVGAQSARRAADLPTALGFAVGPCVPTAVVESA